MHHMARLEAKWEAAKAEKRAAPGPASSSGI